MAYGRTTRNHNSLAHLLRLLTVLWDGVPLSNQHFLQVSQGDGVGHSGTNSTTELILQVFSEVEAKTAEILGYKMNNQDPPLMSSINYSAARCK